MDGKSFRSALIRAAVVGLVIGPEFSWAGPSAFTRGMAAFDAKNYSRAIVDFQKTTQEESRNSAAYFLLGYAYYQQGFAAGNPEAADKDDAKETVAAYRKVLELDPNLRSVSKPYELYFTMALSYEALSQNDEAFTAFQKSADAAPDNFFIPLYAARLRFLTQDMEKAKANLALSLKRAKAQNRKADEISLIKSSALFSSMADNAVLQPLLSPDDSAASDAGDLHDSIRSQAGAALPALPSLSPEDREVLALVAAGETAFHDGRYNNALKSYEQALKLDARMEVLGNARQTLIQERMGFCHRNLGLIALAADDFKKAASLAPFDSEAHYQLALADAVLGQPAQSLQELDWSLKTASSQEDQRRYLVLSKVEPDFGPVRDLPGYEVLAARYSEPGAAARQ